MSERVGNGSPRSAVLLVSRRALFEEHTPADLVSLVLCRRRLTSQGRVYKVYPGFGFARLPIREIRVQRREDRWFRGVFVCLPHPEGAPAMVAGIHRGS